MPLSIRWLLTSLAALVSYASASSCPYIRTSVILAECVFETSQYISLGAHVSNATSIDFIGHYALQHPNDTAQLNSNTLIYNLGHRWMLLVPLLLRCSHQPANVTFTECQYTMRQYPSKSRTSVAEYMTTQLSVMNITDLGKQSVLFLQPGLSFEQTNRTATHDPHFRRYLSSLVQSLRLCSRARLSHRIE